MTTDFDSLLAEVADMHRRKTKDYGTETDRYANVRAAALWGIPAWVGAGIRISDKVRRLQTYSVRRRLANEGVEDSLLDIATYALIALALFREENSDGRGPAVQEGAASDDGP